MTASINTNVLGLCCVDGYCPFEYFKLDENSFVVDLGSFRGDFSKYIYETYNCRVDAYDPIGINVNAGHPKFRFIQKAVFDGSKVFFELTGPSSHIMRNEGYPIDSIDIREITKQHIDLMKVNIEGAEIRVLELADLNNVDQLLVEFHLFRACDEDVKLVMREIKNTVERILRFGYKFRKIDESPSYFFYGKT